MLRRASAFALDARRRDVICCRRNPKQRLCREVDEACGKGGDALGRSKDKSRRQDR
jgi:hypothetical protein